MDAVRLIRATRQALTRTDSVEELVAEAWQSLAIAEAVGGHLGEHGPVDLRNTAFSLREAGRARGSTGPPAAWIGAVRAARLTGVRDASETLRDLRDLLEDLGGALMSVTCSTEDETEYWQCIEAVDAADDSRDRVCALLCAMAGDV